MPIDLKIKELLKDNKLKPEVYSINKSAASISFKLRTTKGT